MLFIDADGSGTISNLAEYVFTEWDRSAGDDMEALRRAFDSNGDGKLTSADARWGEFRVQVTNADGSTSVKTLAELGITEINLTADATKITLPDGSAITGQASFIMNGSVRTAANTTLMAEAQGYRIVETVSTDGMGARTVVQTGYDASGDRAFVIRSVASADGLSVTNRFDVNGDGVTDQIQTIQTVINGDGSRTETVVNMQGAVIATAAVLSRIVTTTSADGRQVTVQTDSSGGGWFDRSEVRATALDGSRTTTTAELAEDGSTIRCSSETISANGLTRVNAANLDGAGAADRITTQTISYNLAGDRTEVVAVTNQDGSARVSETTVTSANGLTTTTTTDLNGNGSYDVWSQDQITRIPNGTTSTVAIVRNADNSLRSQINSTVSADGLTRTAQINPDGDADFDLNENDVTVIDGSGVRARTITITNTDGSINSMERTILGADSVTGESWVDQNQNGVFEATDLERSVTVNAVTGLHTETTWDRNPDGTSRAVRVEQTSSNGLSVSATVDADGDGDVDLRISDGTVVNGDGSSTRTIYQNNQDSSRLALTVIETSADGLHVHISRDIGGFSPYDEFEERTISVDGAGAVTTTIERTAGNGTTLLSGEVTVRSADRLSTTVTSDANGDGANERIASSVESDDGTIIVTDARYHANGSLAARDVTTTSANGLASTFSRDLNGDGLHDRVTQDTTTLAADGSAVRHVENLNGNGNLASQSRTTVSDDGLMTVSESDLDGDGIYERVVTSTTTLAANGSRTTLEAARSASNAIISRSEVSVSDDQLVVTRRSDADGDGDFDLTATSTTALQTNGGQIVTVELRNATNALRERTVTTTSDDGRSITIQEDANGDGAFDRDTTRIIADTGALTETVTDHAIGGAMTARSQTTISDDGLATVRRQDIDGDGTYDQTEERATVLDADGGRTTTVLGKAADGSVFRREVTETSDDGWQTVISRDLEGDGIHEFVSSETLALSTSGVRTVTATLHSEDNTLLRREITTTSADQRTVTVQTDLDGNGTNDLHVATVIAANGQVSTTTTRLSTGGALEGRQVVSVSGDGRTRVESRDATGDGRYERVITAQTTLAADGSVATETVWRSDRHVVQAQTLVETSDDGLRRTVLVDDDGDGIFDFRAEEERVLNADGSAVSTAISFDQTSARLGSIVATTSGNGLVTTTETDMTGDGNPDRVHLLQRYADGAAREEMERLDPGGDLTEALTIVTSADGRTIETNWDRNGDGAIDRRVVLQEDIGRNVTITHEDLQLDGDIDVRVTETRLANGTATTFAIDRDGNGFAEVMRMTVIDVEGDGDRVTTVTEHYNPIFGSYGIQRLAYEARTTAAADGLSSTTEYDIDGDGLVDGVTERTTEYSAAGVRTDIRETVYADGNLRERLTITTSADGRHVLETADYDGNGAADQIVERETGADSSVTITRVGFSEGGIRGQAEVTTTSADGLTTTIARSSGVQTVTRSLVDDQSYAWNNGQTPSSSNQVLGLAATHVVDPLGFETWTLVESWYSTSTYSVQSTTYSSGLDAAAKAAILAEAARLYDTVFDRDMDTIEVERLVAHVSNGQLDRATLATALLGSNEFTTRYGTLSNAEFVTQLYLNSYNRAPTLSEIDREVRALATGTTRSDLAARVAETIEHSLVGNSHIATNNFDVIINPVVFDRFLDRAYVESLISALVDTAYDRDATPHELHHLSNLMLNGSANLDDLAEVLLMPIASGQVFGVNATPLGSLSGASLVEQAFINAFGRQPSTAQLQTWTENLSSGRFTIAQFIATLAMSVDKSAAGNGHETLVAPTITTRVGAGGGAGADSLTGNNGQDDMFGGPGNDSLYGGGVSDRLDGGEGNDLLDGGAGADVYVWRRAATGVPQADVIHDTGSYLESWDRLILANVNSTDVSLERGGSGNDGIILRIGGSTTETIELRDMLDDPDSGVGIETIEFADGIVWNRVEILRRTITYGSNTLTGLNGPDRILGTAGNDSVVGNDDDDTLEGGIGRDTLVGGNGSDQYVWLRADNLGGAVIDDIRDNGASIDEIDELRLTDSLPEHVTLKRSGNSLLVEVSTSAGTRQITITNQFASAQDGVGIERIVFQDGTIWATEDIAMRTTQTSSGNFSGTTDRDALIGDGAGNTISGGAGDDTLTGGGGNDSLKGQAGSDDYVWTIGDGNDTINDDASSVIDVDTLYLTNVTSAGASLTRGSATTLNIGIGAATIAVQDQFDTSGNGRGIERILFSDGVIWTSQDILARTRWSGSSVSGSSLADNIYGETSNDSLSGGSGDDLIVGGVGNDTLNGNSGNDRFEWSSGHGDDTIRDDVASLTEVDTLALNGISLSNVTLDRDGNNLLVIIAGGSGATLKVQDQFSESNPGRGIEIIEYGDGSTTQVMLDAEAQLITNATAAAESVTGWAFSDIIYGLDGNDSLYGQGGNDTLSGGNDTDRLYGGAGSDILIGGTGNDSLEGGAGGDTYLWSRGNDNDTINDTTTSLTDIDVLELTDVEQGDVTLTRANGSNNLVVTIAGAGTGTISVTSRFASPTEGCGIERIAFSDGSSWNLDEILARTQTLDVASTNSLTGTGYADNLYGGSGNDTINGGAGQDRLYGGAGADILNGQTGGDRYIWARNDGADTINDNSASLSEVDTLVLVDVLPADVSLSRSNGSAHLTITIGGDGGAVLTVQNMYTGSITGTGIERIEFADGTAWTIDDIEAETIVNAVSPSGSARRDNLYASSGNDNVYGGAGDDWLHGMLGNDTLNGGAGSDRYIWSATHGADTIDDTSTSLAEIDTLVLHGILSSAVTLHRTEGSVAMIVRVDLGGSHVDITVTRQVLGLTDGRGIERIEFGDGSEWTLEEILSRIVMYGSAGNDTLTGVEFPDYFVGGAGNDRLTGYGSADQFDGGAGADSMYGGNGADTAIYANAVQGVSVDLRVAMAQTGVPGVLIGAQ